MSTINTLFAGLKRLPAGIELMVYVIAWIVVLLAGLGGLIGVYVLTRSIPSLFPRTLVRSLITVWMLIPAPVPHYDGQYAPAFIVVMFEWLLQSNGDPSVAVRILIAATLVVVGLVSLAHGLKNYRSRRQRAA